VDLINHLSQLETAGLIQVAQISPELEYLFRHTLVQDAVYASLLDTDQRRLHQNVGETLEWLYASRINELAATLAEHFEKAGDTQRALKYHRLAAERAAAAYANQEAESHFHAAIELATAKETRADLLAGLGEVLFHQSRYSEAEHCWQEAINLYRSLDNCDRAARLQARCARGAWFAGDTPRGLQLCLEGLEAAKQAPESEGVAVLVHEAARASYFNGKPEEASRLCRQALSMAERLGSIEVQADALATLGILPDTPPEEALKALKQAVELAESAGFLHIASRALVNLGNAVHTHQGDIENALKHFSLAVELARKRGALSEEIIPLVSAASLLLKKGEISEAEKHLATIQSLRCSLTDPGTIEMVINALQFGILTTQGQFTKALPLMRANIQEARQRGDLQNLVQSCIELVDALIEMDHLTGIQDWDEAEDALNTLLATDMGGKEKAALTYSLASAVKARQRKFGEARHFLELARQASMAEDYPGHMLPALRAAFELAYAQGRWTEALKALEETAQHRQLLGYVQWGRILTWQAIILMNRAEPDDIERAQAMLLEAQTIFENAGSLFYHDYASRLMEASREQTYAQARAQKQVAQELRLAGELQGSFLPQEPPQLPGWQVAASIKPARAISGDFYDFIPLPGEKLGIVIADVADKGIGAALFMTSTRTLLRAYAEEFCEHPERAIEAVNRRITHDTHGGLFVTMFYGVLDPADGNFWYCNAGHNPPFIRHADGHFQELKGTGYPVAVFEQATWSSDSAQIEAGSLLVLYTDGVTEAENAQGEMFGFERLLQSSAQMTTATAQLAHEAILRALKSFTSGAPQGDDITLVVLSRE